MSYATRNSGARFVLAAALFSGAGWISTAAGQSPAWNPAMYGGYAAPMATGGAMVPPNGYVGYPMAGQPNNFTTAAPQPANNAANSASRRPLARLVRNTNTSDGSPPFALTDQAGRVQRYVEPVPSVDLEAHVGEVVVVRHDTGRTILATQLELPPRPLLPMGGQSATGADTPRGFASQNRLAANQAVVGMVNTARPARYIDNDDTTVQLISDGTDSPQATADDTERSRVVTPLFPNDSNKVTTEEMPPLGGLPMDSHMEEMPMSGPAFPDSYVGDGMPGEFEMGDACPNCGRRHGLAGCDDRYADSGIFQGRTGAAGLLAGHCYADVQLNFLRLHLMEGSVGKLGERYELSPRFTLGFDGNGSLGFRARYWNYDRETPILSGGGIRVEMNVVDLEATQRFQLGKSDFTAAAGFRWAGVDIEDADGDGVGTDLVGVTFGLDGHTPVCTIDGGQLAWVYGGRLSILGGDWEGSSNNDLVPAPLQDDNVVVDSVFLGVQYATLFRNCHLVGRLAFEMQNWHSDVLSQNAGADSLGFFGPGVHIGATF